TAGTVNIRNSTIAGIDRGIAAAIKANAPGPIIDFRVTNTIVTAAIATNAVYTDFGATNFTIGYSLLENGWPGTGNLSGDPLFVNAAANDYHLQPGSPCINTGDPASPPDPDGSAADMGVYPGTSNLSVALTSPSNGSVF